jgi:CRISPR/Cas system-associated exonuclease Cas4 (RecB family)
LYFFKYIEKGEAEPRHVLTIMGSALHKSIEEYYRNDKPPKLTFNKEFYDGVALAEAEVGVVGRDSPTQVALLGQSILDSIDWSFKPVELEMAFRLPFPNKENPVCTLRGVIDMIVSGGTIIDHKSSKTKPTKKKLADNYQFTLYAWAYRELYGELPEKVYWHHLRTQELIEADVITDIDTKIEKIADDVRQILADTEYNKIPKSGFCERVCHFHNVCWGEESVEDLS